MLDYESDFINDSKYSQITCKIQQDPDARHPSKKISTWGMKDSGVGDT